MNWPTIHLRSRGPWKRRKFSARHRTRTNVDNAFISINLEGTMFRILRGLLQSSRQSSQRLWNRLTIEVLESRLAPATCVWLGSATSNSWLVDTNWDGGQHPFTGDTVVFDGTRSQNNCNIQTM